MVTRLVRFGLVAGAGWLVWKRLRNQNAAFVSSLDASPDPADIERAVEDAVETSPHVRQSDPVELAFVASALGIDLVPDQTPVAPPQATDTPEQETHD